MLVKNTDGCSSSNITEDTNNTISEDTNNAFSGDTVPKQVYEELLGKYEIIKKQNKELQEQIKSQQIKIDNLEGQIVKVNNSLDSMFSKAQMDIILRNKKKVIWQTSDISRAFALRYLSRRCYNYVRSTLKFPLPHLNTLQKWAAKLNFKEKGLLKDVINFMNIAGMKMTGFERTTVLQYDEMKVNSIYEYDKVFFSTFCMYHFLILFF